MAGIIEKPHELKEKLLAVESALNKYPASVMPTISATIEKAIKCLIKEIYDNLDKNSQEYEKLFRIEKEICGTSTYHKTYTDWGHNKLLRFWERADIPVIWLKVFKKKYFPTSFKLPNMKELYFHSNPEKHGRQDEKEIKLTDTQIKIFYYQVLNFLDEGFPHIIDVNLKRPVSNNNLPRITHDFVGREEQLKQLLEWLSEDSRAWLISITGIGGVGKTELALEAARKLLENKDAKEVKLNFDYYVWTSAKRRRLSGDRIIESDYATSNKEDIISEIIKVIAPEKSAPSPKKQEELVERLLREYRVLLLVDNMETIEDDQVIDFLKTLPSRSKAIITDRRSVKESFSIELTEMSYEEALEFINNILKDAKINLNDEDKTLLIKNTGGIPLAVEWAIGQLKSGKDTDTVFRTLANADSSMILDFLFAESFKSISTNSKKMLAALSLPETSIEGRFLMQWTRLGENDAKDALYQLEDFALISEEKSVEEAESEVVKNKLERFFRVLPLTRNFVLEQKSIIDGHFIENITNSVFRMLTDNEDFPDWPSIRTIDLVDKYHKLFAWAMKSAYDQQDYSLVAKIMRYIGYSLGVRGYHNLRLKSGHLALDAAKKGNLTSEDARNLITNVGWVHFIWYEFDEARKASEEGLELAKNCGDQVLVGSATRALGLIKKENKDFSGAEKWLNQALEIFQRNREMHYLATTYGSLGSLKRDQGNYQTSEEYYKKAIEITENIKNPEEVRSIQFQKMSKLMVKIGRLEEAELYVHKALRILETLKSPIGKAYCKLDLALIHEERGDFPTALSYAREAESLFVEYGAKEDIAEDLNRILNKVSQTV